MCDIFSFLQDGHAAKFGREIANFPLLFPVLARVDFFLGTAGTSEVYQNNRLGTRCDKIRVVSDDMQKEMMALPSADFPYAGRAEFIRGERNYNIISNPDKGLSPLPLVFKRKDEPDFVFSLKGLKTTQGCVKLMEGLIEDWEKKVKNDPSRTLMGKMRRGLVSPGEGSDAMKDAGDLEIITGIRANAAGFGKAAWDKRDFGVAINAFEVAGVLGNPTVRRLIRDIIDNPRYNVGLRVECSQAGREVIKERKRKLIPADDIEKLFRVI